MRLKIAIDGKTYELEVEAAEEDAAPRGRGYLPPYPETEAALKRRPASLLSRLASVPADGPLDEAKVCRSPLAGVVVRVNVEAGQQLKQDDPIMVLEAMKMETSIAAPAAGKVKIVKVAPGEGVKVNQILVEFE